VFIAAVTLWLTASPSSLTQENVQYSKEMSIIVPTIQNGEYGTLYNKEVNSTVEYIFVFNKSEVSNSLHKTNNRIGIFSVSAKLFYLSFRHFCTQNLRSLLFCFNMTLFLGASKTTSSHHGGMRQFQQKLPCDDCCTTAKRCAVMAAASCS
jgi:hypothetical protein